MRRVALNMTRKTIEKNKLKSIRKLIFNIVL